MSEEALERLLFVSCLVRRDRLRLQKEAELGAEEEQLTRPVRKLVKRDFDERDRAITLYPIPLSFKKGLGLL
jgi:hypothetical protein